MKKAISMWGFPAEMDIPARIRAARELGFDGMELCLAGKGAFSMESEESEVRGYRELAEREGLQLGTVCSGMFFQCSLTSRHAEIRDRAKAVIRREIDFAAIVGASVVLAVPGIVGTDFQPHEVVPDAEPGAFFAGGEIVDYEEAWDRSLAAFRELAGYAGDHGVVIGVENIWGKFLISPLEMRTFVDAVDSPWVGAYFDVGNAVLFGYPEQWIRILGKRLRAVHLKDFRRGSARLDGFVDLLAGDVDWPAVTNALRGVGFDGWVTAETTPVYKHYGELTARAASAAMDRILQRK